MMEYYKICKDCKQQFEPQWKGDIFCQECWNEQPEDYDDGWFENNDENGNG